MFIHQYSIYKNYQIYPSYLIDFTVNSNKQQLINRQYPPCENCSRYPPNPSKIYCVTEDAYFCADCDHEQHNSNVGRKHNKGDISEKKPKKFGNCSTH